MEIRANVNGQWVSIELTKEEVKEVRRETLQQNSKIIKKIDEVYKDLSIEYRALLAGSIIQHAHFKMETYAKLKYLKKIPATSVNWK